MHPDLRFLEDLREAYKYNADHNIYYMACRDAILKFGIKDLLVVGCGKGIVEAILPETVRCYSVDVNDADLHIADEINRRKPNRAFAKLNLFELVTHLRGRRFQAALLSEVIEHLADDIGALRVVSSCLIERGTLVLTVPNVDRLVNATRKALGMRPHFMAESHLREYTKTEILGKLCGVGLTPLRFQEVCLTLPKDRWVGKILSPYHPWRRNVLKNIPHLATYFLIVSRLSKFQHTHSHRAWSLE